MYGDVWGDLGTLVGSSAEVFAWFMSLHALEQMHHICSCGDGFNIHVVWRLGILNSCQHLWFAFLYKAVSSWKSTLHRNVLPAYRHCHCLGSCLFWNINVIFVVQLLVWSFLHALQLHKIQGPVAGVCTSVAHVTLKSTLFRRYWLSFKRSRFVFDNCDVWFKKSGGWYAFGYSLAPF